MSYYHQLHGMTWENIPSAPRHSYAPPLDLHPQWQGLFTSNSASLNADNTWSSLGGSSKRKNDEDYGSTDHSKRQRTPNDEATTPSVQAEPSLAGFQEPEQDHIISICNRIINQNGSIRQQNDRIIAQNTRILDMLVNIQSSPSVQPPMAQPGYTWSSGLKTDTADGDSPSQPLVIPDAPVCSPVSPKPSPVSRKPMDKPAREKQWTINRNKSCSSWASHLESIDPVPISPEGRYVTNSSPSHSSTNGSSTPSSKDSNSNASDNEDFNVIEDKDIEDSNDSEDEDFDEEDPYKIALAARFLAYKYHVEPIEILRRLDHTGFPPSSEDEQFQSDFAECLTEANWMQSDYKETHWMQSERREVVKRALGW